MPKLTWVRQRFSIATLCVLLTFCLVAAFSLGILCMLLLRQDNHSFSDKLLPHYFAYWQDLPAAALALALLLALPFLRGGASPKPLRIRPGIVAGAVLIGCLAGTYAVFGNYPLSFDEYLANFDAEIFRHGQLLAPLAPEWRPFAHALQPEFLLAPGNLAWSSAYLPVNAALRSPFALFGVTSLASPLLAALSILLVFNIARRLIPDSRECAVVACLMLASSAQFLVTAMTPYAMTAHLTLNLLWLWLVLQDRRWAVASAALVSFAATGLHQLVFHPIFVAPFLPWLWFGGRRWTAVVLGAALAVSVLFWASYGSLLSQLVNAPPPPASDPGSLLDKAALLVRQAWRPISLTFMAENLLRLLVWQNPLSWVLAFAPFLAPRRQPTIIWPLLAGAVGTLLMMMLVLPYQGHGWGYRYLHGFLGSFALLAAFGWQTIAGRGAEHDPRLQTWLKVSLAALLLLLPLHAVQAHRFTLPYRQAHQAIGRIDADIIIIEDRGRWYGEDLVRNDPYLRNRPLRLLARHLPWQDVRQLCLRHRTVVLDRSSTPLHGLRPLTFRGELSGGDKRLGALRALGCGQRSP